MSVIVDRYRLTPSGAIVFRNKKSMIGRAKYSVVANIGNWQDIRIHNIKLELGHTENSYYTPSYTSIDKRTIGRLAAEKSILTLGQLVSELYVNKDLLLEMGFRSRCKEVTEAVLSIASQANASPVGDSTASPVCINLVIKNPSESAAKFNSLSGELRSIVLEELTDKIRNHVGEVVSNVDELKRQKDIKKLESEIKQAQAKLAVLSMPDNVSQKRE